MVLQYFYSDIITIAIAYILFWAVIIILIIYPKLRLKKISERIKKLEKNLKEQTDIWEWRKLKLLL